MGIPPMFLKYCNLGVSKILKKKESDPDPAVMDPTNYGSLNDESVGRILKNC